MNAPADIHKAGLLLIRDGRVLLCRKSQQCLLILPGGKLEPGESCEDCLVREIAEELGVGLNGLRYVGTYRDVATDPAKTIQVDLFTGDLTADPAPQSEIEELVWFGREDESSVLAPSLRNRILPDIIRRGFLDWDGPDKLEMKRF